MKKFKFIAIVALLAVVMMSCGFNGKLRSMEKACRAGDFTKYEKIKEEADKYKDDTSNKKISDAQEERYKEVVSFCTKKKAEKDSKEER